MLFLLSSTLIYFWRLERLAFLVKSKLQEVQTYAMKIHRDRQMFHCFSLNEFSAPIPRELRHKIRLPARVETISITSAERDQIGFKKDDNIFSQVKIVNVSQTLILAISNF